MAVDSAPSSFLQRRATFLAGAAIAVAAALAYANSFFGPFIFDDFLSIPQNPTLHSLTAALTPPGGGVTVTGRPVLNLSFALNWLVSGDAVWSYHWLNLAIHVAAGLALFGVVRRTAALAASRAGGRAEETGLALAVALLWTVHPLQTESVTYIVQRAESLAGLWYLLTLYAFLRSLEGRRTRVWQAVAVGSCLLGMGTKEVMVTAPVVVWLHDRTFVAGSFREAWRRRRGFYLALAATWLPLAVLVFAAANRGGSAGFSAGLGFGAYVATQFGAVVHYLRLAVWPTPLIIDYGAQRVGGVAEVVGWSAVVGVLGGGTLVALWRRRAAGFLGAAFFLILAPTSLVPIVRQTMAEHRMYLPLAAVVAAAVWVGRRWLGRWSWLAFGPAVLVLAVMTFARNFDYRSSEAIWRDTVQKRPENPYAHNNYGNLLAQAGRLEEALTHYESAMQLAPAQAEGFFNAGKALVALGRVEEGAARYAEAVRLRPGDGEARRALALAQARAGQVESALAQLEEARRLAPQRVELESDFGDVLRMAGRPAEAVTHYEAALRLRADDVRALRGLGDALRELERLPEALHALERAVVVAPERPEVRNDLGLTLLLADRPAEAVVQFEAALQLNPDLAEVHMNLALVLANMGRMQQAAAHYEAARRLGLAVPPMDFGQ